MRYTKCERGVDWTNEAAVDARRVSVARRALRLLNAGMGVTAHYANVLVDVLEYRSGCFAASDMPQWADEDLRQSREDRHGRMRRRVWLA